MKTYPECLIVHLVRDGRDFVRSGFNRSWYTKRKDRFEEICRLWVRGQRMTRDAMKKIPEKNNGGVIKLEDLRFGDISWFIQKRLGLKSDVKILMPAKHVAKKHNIPPWPQWGKDRVIKAKAIMGADLKHFGYRW